MASQYLPLSQYVRLGFPSNSNVAPAPDVATLLGVVTSSDPSSEGTKKLDLLSGGDVCSCVAVGEHGIHVIEGLEE
jgi:hypothetical protein